MRRTSDEGTSTEPGGEGVRDPGREGAARAESEPALTKSVLSLGPVHLTVSDLARSLAFYRDAVGLRTLEERGGGAVLGTADRELLVLAEEPGARPAGAHTGLFHFALLLPERHELAAWLAHAVRDRVPLAGLSDHFVSEAVYLSDPDGHGIEIYWDRPRAHWEGRVAERMTTLPLDTGDLFGDLRDPAPARFEGLPAGTVMGHVHLRVAAIPEAISFYRDVLGLDLMAQLGDAAAFLGAGGYHHHIGANTWQSAGAPPPPPGTAALRRLTIMLPSEPYRAHILSRAGAAGLAPEESDAGPVLADPSGNRLLLAVA